MSDIPGYLRDYLLSAKPPEGCCVPEGSLPALVEGRLLEAKVATIGINPHSGPHTGEWLRRDYSPLDREGSAKLWAAKEGYFEKRHYPYFGRLERVLRQGGVSFGGKYDPEGSYPYRACSLDIVQWPTGPMWSELRETAQRKLLEDGRLFFRRLLEENPQIRLLIGNGHTVAQVLEQAFSVKFESVRPIGDFALSTGKVHGVTFSGWNYFLSRRGVTVPQMEALGERVFELAGDICPPA